ncbi:hypothetical protein EA187_07360 [Lujinxingia sediminis]|uniref:Uncharacterized protein n=1 Tax=Lujinxingia sediminis TaxID=2480984 RepID=A0ABY0CVY5_9DELT|nr:hypothetical protein [Lujinxingia sediminis]RVU46945.1 hypothetical protein EA187_07360 [Lujinxingia sediminis]
MRMVAGQINLARWRAGVWGVALAAVMLVGSVAGAQELSSRSLRSWDAPTGVDPRLAQVRDDGQGTTLLVMSAGEELESRCVVVVAYEDEALSYGYRRAGAPSRCEDAFVLPGGAGFVVRGDRMDLPAGLATGFVARIARSGEEVWAVEDRQIAEDEDYVGAWEATGRGMAFDAVSGMVAVLTQAQESVGGRLRETVQLHGVNVDDGQVMVVGARPEGGQGEVIDDVAADTSGGFWVTLKELQGVGRQLWSYDGAGGWQSFSPSIDAWERREVVGGVRTLDDGSVVVFWRVRGEAVSGVTRVREGEVIFDRELEFDGELEGRWVPLSDVARGWVGAGYIAALRQASDGQRVLELRSVDDGERLAVGYWERLAVGVELGLVSGADGEPVVLTYISVDESLREFRLEVEETVRSPGTGADGGGEGGCVVAGGGGAPERLWWWVLVGMFAGARRRGREE